MKKKNIYELDSHKQNTIYDSAYNQINENYDLRYDEIAHEFEIKLKNEKEWHELNLNSLIINLSKSGITITTDKLIILLNSNMIEHYNPLVSYFNNLPKWDNEDYIKKLASYLPVIEPEEFEYHLKKWMVRAVKCALEPSYFNKNCLVIVHKGQSSGKSTWCRFLCPPKLSKYFAEDIASDKDSRILLTTSFIINLDELSVLARKEINSLKAYFSKTSINERLPYDKRNTTLSRTCSFIGSTNQSTFLSDETGNVRWLCFELLGQIDFNYSKEVDINKVWTQAFHLAYYDDKFNPELTVEDIEKNEMRNKMYAKLTTEQELIAKYYEKSNEMIDFVTASDVLIKLNSLNLKLNHINIGKAFSGFGFQRIKHNSRQVYGYLAKCKFADSPWEIELKNQK